MDSKVVEGSLFSVLPLPIATTQPVYIHGPFSISADRARLYYHNDRSNQDQYGPSWNDWLFKNAIPATWIKLLGYLADLYDLVAAFERWPKITDNEHDPLSSVFLKVINTIDNECLPLWPTGFGYKTWKNSLLATGNESDSLKEALREAEVPVVYVPLEFRKIHEEAEGIFKDRILSARSLCQFLKLERQQVGSLTEKMKLQMLEYLLSDDQLTEYDGLEIFPFRDGKYRAIGEEVVFIHRNEFEDNLFAMNGFRTIDVEKLLPETKFKFKLNCNVRKVHPSIQFHSAVSLEEYSISMVFNKISRDQDIVALNEKQSNFASNVRIWLIHHEIDFLNEHISNLWLLPLSNMQYRRIRPKYPKSKVYLPPDGEIGALMRKLDAKLSAKSLPLLVLGNSEIDFRFVLALKKYLGAHSPLAINDGGNIISLVTRLQETAVIDDGVVDKDRVLVAKTVASHTSQTFSATEHEAMRQALADLKIFQSVSLKEDGSKMHVLSLLS